MLMGMNFYNVGNCLPHRIQYLIGATTGTSHAAGLAALKIDTTLTWLRMKEDQIYNLIQKNVTI